MRGVVLIDATRASVMMNVQQQQQHHHHQQQQQQCDGCWLMTVT